jgi:hypothetical protein
MYLPDFNLTGVGDTKCLQYPLCYPAQAALTKYHRLAGLKNRS